MIAGKKTITVAAVAVRSLDSGKNRLSVELGYENKSLVKELIMGMFLDILDVLSSSITQSIVDLIIVCSSDDKLLDLSKERNFLPLKDDGRNLNSAVLKALNEAKKGSATQSIIIMGDTPLINIKNIRDLVEIAKNYKRVVVACPTNDGGTSTVLFKPCNVMEPVFGGKSFKAFQEKARLEKVPFRKYDDPSVTLDIDTLKDLEKSLKILEDKKSGVERSIIPKRTLKASKKILNSNILPVLALSR
ncbi:MAG: 2-phospho-L-lactate guanylyltransferase [Asgard group archaeon]